MAGTDAAVFFDGTSNRRHAAYHEAVRTVDKGKDTAARAAEQVKKHTDRAVEKVKDA